MMSDARRYPWIFFSSHSLLLWKILYESRCIEKDSSLCSILITLILRYISQKEEDEDDDDDEWERRKRKDKINEQRRQKQIENCFENDNDNWKTIFSVTNERRKERDRESSSSDTNKKNDLSFHFFYSLLLTQETCKEITPYQRNNSLAFSLDELNPGLTILSRTWTKSSSEILIISRWIQSSLCDF